MPDKDASVRLSVIMPAYNEAKVIAEALSQTVMFLDGFGATYEIVVVDDHSTDATGSIVSAFAASHAQVALVSNTLMPGKGSALKCGWNVAKGEIICFLDSDLDIHPTLLRPILGILESERVDAVVGSKRHPASVVAYPWKRRMMSWGYCVLIRMLFRLPVRDTQTGIKAIRKSALDCVMPHTRMAHYAHDLETVLLLDRMGYSIREAPITVAFHRTSGGRIGWAAAWRTFTDTVRLWFRFRLHPQGIV